MFSTIGLYTQTDQQPVHATNERYGTRLVVSRDYTRFKMSALYVCNWIKDRLSMITTDDKNRSSCGSTLVGAKLRKMKTLCCEEKEKNNDEYAISSNGCCLRESMAALNVWKIRYKGNVTWWKQNGERCVLLVAPTKFSSIVGKQIHFFKVYKCPNISN